MAELTLREIDDRRRHVEKAITTLLMEFEESTGVSVEEVTLDKFIEFGSKTSKVRNAGLAVTF